MYIRGFYKLDNVPTALFGVLILALSLQIGYLHTKTVVGYTRAPLSPLISRSQTCSAGLLLNGSSSIEACAGCETPTPDASRLLNALYLANHIVVAIAIFHAGTLPLYKYDSEQRYPNALQDAFASFGWSFLSFHHVALNLMLLLLVFGARVAVAAAPALLLFPLLHFSLRLLPSLPPRAHYWLGLGLDSSHLLLMAVYAYRAVLYSPWELYGVAAEALHLASVVPEYLVHHNRPDEDVGVWRTKSFASPFGATKSDTTAAGPIPQPQDVHDKTRAPAQITCAQSKHAWDINGKKTDDDLGDAFRNMPANNSSSPSESSFDDTLASDEADDSELLKEGKSRQQATTGKPSVPVFPMLVLINAASFFFYGGMLSFQ